MGRRCKGCGKPYPPYPECHRGRAWWNLASFAYGERAGFYCPQCFDKIYEEERKDNGTR